MKKRLLCLLAALLSLLLLFSACNDNLTATGNPPPSSLAPSSQGQSVSAPALPSAESDPSKMDGSSAPSSLFSPSPSPSFSPSPSPTPVPPSPILPTTVWTPPTAPDFRCTQAFIYDVEEGFFRYICGEDRIIYPASTTKLLTILYALTLLEDVNQKVAPGNELELVGPNSSIAYIKSHHVLTVEQLVEGMLLPSGNDAAYVLAAAAGRVLDPGAKDGKAAVAAFIAGMNEYGTKTLGLTGSQFINPDGYDNEDHYSTLEDMALVARAAYDCPLIRKYCNMERDDVVYASGHKMTWKNTNINLWEGTRYYSPYVNGLKTGAVNSSYYCLLSSAEINGRAFIFGFFGEPNADARFEDTLVAINWVRNYVL